MGVAILTKAEYAANFATLSGGLPMIRRQKDPLRPLTDDERDWLMRVARSQAEPAAHVAGAKALRSPSLAERATPKRPKPPDAALGKQSLVWFHASTGRGSQPSSLDTAVVLQSSTRMPSAGASSPRRAGLRREIGTALLPGRSRRCAERCGKLPTDCRRSRPYHLEDPQGGGFRLAEGS
jgi:hypothetical protein